MLWPGENGFLPISTSQNQRKRHLYRSHSWLVVKRARGADGRHTDDGELCRHQKTKKEKDGLEHGPALRLEEFPTPRGQNQGVPCSDGEGAHKEVLVCGEVSGKAERVWQQIWVDCDVGHDGGGRGEEKKSSMAPRAMSW
jgi:hypothetical protein